jgi:hypothetical protein
MAEHPVGFIHIYFTSVLRLTITSFVWNLMPGAAEHVRRLSAIHTATSIPQQSTNSNMQNIYHQTVQFTPSPAILYLAASVKGHLLGFEKPITRKRSLQGSHTV